MIRTQPLAVGLLLQGLAEHGDFRAHGMGQLDAHVAKSAETDDGDFFPRPGFPVPERRIECDARA